MSNQPSAPPQDGAVLITMVLTGRDEVGVSRDAEALPRIGRVYADRTELLARLAADADDLALVRAWLVEVGFTVHSVWNAKLIVFSAMPDALVTVFGKRAERWLADSGVCSPSSWPLPPHIRGLVSTMTGHDAASTRKLVSALPAGPTNNVISSVRVDVPDVPAEVGAYGSEPEDANALGALHTDCPPERGWRPADVRRFYTFPDPSELDGSGQTVSILAVGVFVDPKVLETFWREVGVARKGELVIVNVGWEGEPPPGADVETFEAYMTIEWLGAMAPGARLVVYNLNPNFVTDLHTGVLTLAIADLVNKPSVVVTSWTMPESRYEQWFGLAQFEGLLDAAALAGMTMVCASGDWGVYDGRPQSRGALKTNVCFAPWPQSTFPVCCERVLGVGGTMITTPDPLTETVWSGPLPPYQEIRDGVPLTLLATSGGFSERTAIPEYQSKAVSVERPFARGTHQPAVVPYGRGIPDVGVAAAGPSVLRPGDVSMSSTGYVVYTPSGWVDFGGGTSTGAPVWGAIVALVNQALAAKGAPALGQPHDVLYGLASDKKSKAFRPITTGASDVKLRVVSWDNRDREYVLDGFEAHAGRPGTRPPYAAIDLWNPATGLGVPNVRALVDEVVALLAPAS